MLSSQPVELLLLGIAPMLLRQRWAEVVGLSLPSSTAKPSSAEPNDLVADCTR
jgi:hypothetical protein